MNNHFDISQHKDYLFIIKENISTIHPVYRSDPLNLYLLLGSHTALLLDTGCGLHPLKPIVQNLIGERKLVVFNSHSHWDHVLGNEEFVEVYIHENEVSRVLNPYNVSFLMDSPCPIVKTYREKNFQIPPAPIIKKLCDGDIFDLGEINVKVIHTPGHSPGSICLLTNMGELFTGDVAYYGDQFLPQRTKFPIVLKTLSNLLELCENTQNLELYPSHRQSPCDKSLLHDLYDGINTIDNLWAARTISDFFYSWQIDDNKFRYYISL